MRARNSGQPHPDMYLEWITMDGEFGTSLDTPAANLMPSVLKCKWVVLQDRCQPRGPNRDTERDSWR